MGHERDDASDVEYGGAAPTIRVLVHRDGELIHRELCESEAAAREVADRWSESGEGVTCTIDDLGSGHRAGDILEPDLEAESGREPDEGRA